MPAAAAMAVATGMPTGTGMAGRVLRQIVLGQIAGTGRSVADAGRVAGAPVRVGRVRTADG
jgi:hypothetical protein